MGSLGDSLWGITQRNENLAKMRLSHSKIKADVDPDENIRDVRHLRQDTKDLSKQLTAQAV